MVEDLHADLEGRRLPHFLGVGAQKAGTTWLWENLRLHPDIWLPPRKELHFLDRHWDLGYTWYMRHFGPRRIAGRIAGEITPNYLVSDPARIATMHHINPDLRIIVLVREPVERSWSAARYFAKNRLSVDIEDLSLAEFARLARTRFVFERGDYRTGIGRWASAFGEDQVHVQFFDNIVADPVATFQSVADFLGCTSVIEPMDYPLRTVFNAGTNASMPFEHRAILEELLAPQRAWLTEKYGDRGIDWMN